ncbi:unnamed protein product [Closterium sp. Yama58-4]|nr:unnamed protein product [Closterium sp. Yama58-4]
MTAAPLEEETGSGGESSDGEHRQKGQNGVASGEAPEVVWRGRGEEDKTALEAAQKAGVVVGEGGERERSWVRGAQEGAETEADFAQRAAQGGGAGGGAGGGGAGVAVEHICSDEEVRRGVEELIGDVVGWVWREREAEEACMGRHVHGEGLGHKGWVQQGGSVQQLRDNGGAELLTGGGEEGEEREEVVVVAGVGERESVLGWGLEGGDGEWGGEELVGVGEGSSSSGEEWETDCSEEEGGGGEEWEEREEWEEGGEWEEWKEGEEEERDKDEEEMERHERKQQREEAGSVHEGEWGEGGDEGEEVEEEAKGRADGNQTYGSDTSGCASRGGQIG